MKAVEDYIKSIRNPVKKLYAQLYYAHLMGAAFKPPISGLSYMAAQAVRLRLDGILNQDQPVTPTITSCVDCGENAPEVGLVCDECKEDALGD